MALAKWDARVLRHMLHNRHAEDLCVEECKNGPTQAVHRGQLAVLDMWVMRKSWSNMSFIGYEIKISRSDFMRDDKWPKYLPMTNALYIVTPPKLLAPDEIPVDCGLLEPRGGKLTTKKVAPYREIEVPISTLLYILMARSVVSYEKGQALTVEEQRLRRIDAWKEWLQRKEETRELGYQISKKLKRLVEKLKNEKLAANQERDKLEGIKRTLEKLGLNESNVSGWNLEEKLLTKMAKVDIVEAKRAMQHLRQADSMLSRALGITDGT